MWYSVTSIGSFRPAFTSAVGSNKAEAWSGITEGQNGYIPVALNMEISWLGSWYNLYRDMENIDTANVHRRPYVQNYLYENKKLFVRVCTLQYKHSKTRK